MGKRDEGLREWVKREDHIWFANFPSTEEMFRRVNTVDRVPGASTSSRSDGDLSWYGHMTYDKAIEAATKGWLDGAEQVKAASRRVRLDRAIMLGQGRKLKRKVAGSRVDLTAYNQRIPEHMIAKVRVRTNDGTIIRVGVDCGALGGVTGEAMMKRAVAIATVVNAIESTGVACEVMALHSVTFGNRGGGDMATVAHVTKKAAYPVNLERLAFGMGHPSVHRRGVFGVRERFPVALMEGNWWGWWFHWGHWRRWWGLLSCK